MQFLSNELFKRISLFILLNAVDAAVTTTILAMGGDELNPVFNFFLEHGFTVWQAKFTLLSPIAFTWTHMYKESKERALYVLDLGNWIMMGVAIFGLSGLLFAYWPVLKAIIFGT